MKKMALLSLLGLTAVAATAQHADNILPPKVEHAEPLYNDLIRDLGARKGEKEWNFGTGIRGNDRFYQLTSLVEYEFAPANRLGVEIEVPFSFYFSRDHVEELPASRINGLKTAIQYTYFVSPALHLSMAAGYINELEFAPFNRYGKDAFLQGNTYQPFLVVAKSWKKRFHTLLYGAPLIAHHFREGTADVSGVINTSFHYMIPALRTFAGIEVHQEISTASVQLELHPQMRINLSHHLLIGIAAGIPVTGPDKAFSFFMRVIYEP